MTTTGCTTVEECGALADHYMNIAMVLMMISLVFAVLSIVLAIAEAYWGDD
jgi:hypothetical protein